MIEGLLRAMELARQQAALHMTVYLADDARVLEAFAATLEVEAGLLEQDHTDPDVTVTAVRCPCGQEVRVPVVPSRG